MGMTTLCYMERDDKWLMMHRIKEKQDINKGKWLGIGGHFEHGESPEDCLIREVFEETGLTLNSFKFCGFITFLSDMGTPKEVIEYMCLYYSDDFSGELTKDEAGRPYCDEGVLRWVPREEVMALNLWEGDRIFLRLVMDGHPFFSLKMSYSKGKLVTAVLDGRPIVRSI